MATPIEEWLTIPEANTAKPPPFLPQQKTPFELWMSAKPEAQPSPKPKSQSLASMGKAYLSGVKQGVEDVFLRNFLDPGAVELENIYNSLGGSSTSAQQAAAERMQSAREFAANPEMRGIGDTARFLQQIAGTAGLTALPFFRAGKSASPILQFLGGTFGKRLPTKGASMAVSGGLQGGIGALLTREPDQEALPAAAEGGAIGMVVGPLTGTAISTGTNLFELGIGLIMKAAAGQPLTFPERKIAQAFARDEITGPMVQQRLSKLTPEASLADVGGANVRNLAETVASMPGRGASIAQDFLEGRAASQGERLTKATQQATGGIRNVYDDLRGLSEKRRLEAAPLYEEAFNLPVPYNDRIKAILDEPLIKSGIAKGMEIQRLNSLVEGKPFDPRAYAITGFNEAGDPIISGVPNIRLLDAAKRGLDDILEEFRNPQTGRLELNQRGRAIEGLRKSLVSEMDNLTGGSEGAYAKARAAWAGPSKSKDALEMGRKFFNKDSEVTSEMVKGMSKDEKDFFLSGVQRAIIDKVERVGDTADATRAIFRNKSMRDKIAAAFDDPAAYRDFVKSVESEAVYSKTRNEVLKGSQTARRTAGQQDIGIDPSVLVDAVQGNVGSAVMSGIKGVYRGMTAPNENARAAISNMLFNPAQNQKAMQDIQQRLMMKIALGSINPRVAGSLAPIAAISGREQ